MTVDRLESTTLPAAIKASEPVSTAPEKRSRLGALTPPQKAALIIAALGPETAGPIIERIGNKHLRAFARTYAHLQTVPQVALQGIAEEFISRLRTKSEEIKGGYEETRELLSQFMSSDDIIRLMDDIDAPGGKTVWQKLEDADDAMLAKYLAVQNPQVIAVVLSKINAEKASTVLDLFETALAGKIIIRLSRPLQVQREALQVLSDTIEREFFEPMKNSSKSRNPGEMVGAMMNNIMSDKREDLISFIAENVPEILKDVKKSMLTFQDIVDRVPANAISLAIRGVEDEVFLRAVKFGKQNAPSSVKFIFKNMSQRMAKQYEEQLEEIMNVSVNDGEAAQAEFMSVVRSLAASGEIVLNEIVYEDEEERAEEGAEENA